MLVHHSRLPTWPRNCLQDPYLGPYHIIRIDGSRIHVRCSPRLGGELLCAPKQLRHYHSPDEERLARLPRIARGDLLSTQGLAYFMKAVLNAAIGYQALHLPRPQDALRHARQQVTKAWAQQGGWPTSFP